MPYNCPECHKSLKSKRSLDRHTEKFHAADNSDNQDAETLDLDIEKDNASPKTFHCGNCDTVINQGAETCPGCGQPLDWNGL